ncbi:DUF1553 domain-containing protein [Roseiconus nitratireducens]|uniref:DUF1553 domain-containing protein n=1 Tax=Roseiconus nitratireducens TaxID=2605748 RepID=A0A5M6D7C2_9BACT|nr:DUF1553 domain-containing protein [Roseiconus nitratireducens]KAA5541749.1 DUF1553 domain-containing protein [Roseiconus nitratireducens]
MPGRRVTALLIMVLLVIGRAAAVQSQEREVPESTKVSEQAEVSKQAKVPEQAKVIAPVPVVAGDAGDEKRLEFFESRIRPVLVEHCYPCHNSSETAEGGIAVDHRLGMRGEGDSGGIVVPGSPEQSRLMAIVRHEIPGLEMPEGGPKLDPEVIEDLQQWIADGAVDPRDDPPSAADLAAATDWTAVLNRRKKWWSFQPIQAIDPAVGASSATGADHTAAENPIDWFIHRRLQSAGLEPSPAADPATLVRRLFVNLTGLPAGAAASERWTERIANASAADRGLVIEQLIDQLLDRPAMGERWARHWMDWIRYAESHGSEGDPPIVNAAIYRDYLIRAINSDVPVDQLIREHVAGDLLPEPRINRTLGINESRIGTAHWRMVFHGFAPTDALAERVRFTDDQINAFSKAFLGLTVSCARCHDHKFDPISQQDYYALYGVLASCRPARHAIDLPELLDKHREQLAVLKEQIRHAIADDWLGQFADTPKRIMKELNREPKAGDSQPFAALLNDLPPRADDDGVSRSLKRSLADLRDARRQWEDDPNRQDARQWDMSQDSQIERWYRVGAGLETAPQPSGCFAVSPDGERALKGIYPAGVYSHSISDKHAAHLSSPDLGLDGDYELWWDVIGDSEASLRYVVQDYPRRGTVYPVNKLSNRWQWIRHDVSYWQGDRIHLELTTARDAPLLAVDQPRSWFGVRQIWLVPKGQPAPRRFPEHLLPILDAAGSSPPTSRNELIELITATLRQAVEAWRDGCASDAQALLLDEALRRRMIDDRLPSLTLARPLILRYRELESEIPAATRVPGLQETVATNQPLYQRGDHRSPAAPVPRRFLEAIDNDPYTGASSGRLQLAEDLLRGDNPLTRRVLVNRVWHHLFGAGIVRTPDNFGRLGDQPSHPELLDWLANQFARDGWSLKKLIRQIVTSRTWQRSVEVSAEADRTDPENRLLSHCNVRRLEAEAIRDSLLAVSGRLQHQVGGDSVSGDSNRRSVYVRVQRNALDPFLRTFDFPEPFSAVGRRDATNVPAQSLALMNDPAVDRCAESWAKRVLAEAASKNDASRIDHMFREALGRPASEKEIRLAHRYVHSVQRKIADVRRRSQQLDAEITAALDRVETLRADGRARLEAEAGSNRVRTPGGPKPLRRWTFDSADPSTDASREDSLRADDLKRGAKLARGALVLDGTGFAVTQPLETGLSEKTLEAWVQLDDLQQRGGGVLSVQTLDGVTFDAIVFGERDPRQWLAGSDRFARTQSFSGDEESQAADEPVHLVIAYHADGAIIGYRNGTRYGQPYQSDGPFPFQAGQTVISLGLRHLPAQGNRLLRGRILRAAVYDQALTDEQVAARYIDRPRWFSEEQVVQALVANERQELDRLMQHAEDLKRQREALGGVPDSDDLHAAWTELAKAMFSMTEFLYVR